MIITSYHINRWYNKYIWCIYYVQVFMDNQLLSWSNFFCRQFINLSNVLIHLSLFSAFKPTELKTSAQVWNGEEDIFHLMSIKLLFLHLSIPPPALHWWHLCLSPLYDLDHANLIFLKGGDSRLSNSCHMMIFVLSCDNYDVIIWWSSYHHILIKKRQNTCYI